MPMSLMGRPKPRPDVAKLGRRYPAGVLENPEPIAQRFAHSAMPQATLPPVDAPRRSQPAEPTTAAPEMTSSVGVRRVLRPGALAGGLGLVGLALSLIVGAVWLGLNRQTESAPAVPPAEAQAAAPSAVLTTSDRIEAVAGEVASFPVALDGTDGVPPRSVIAIKGLPQGSTLSEGRPYGESEWTLKPDQIGDLTLVLPAGANGEFKLGVALIAPDDTVIAEAETLLVIAPAQVAPAPVAPLVAEAGGVTLPGDGEAAAVAPVAAAREAATSEPAPVPDPGDGDAAETAEPSAPMQTASVRSNDPQPNEVGRAEAGEDGLGSVQPSVFVNMREAPSSSSSVIAVIAKGADLPVLDRKRGWVQVTDPATGKQGWIYSGLLAGEAKPDRRIKRVAPTEAEAKSDSLFGRVGRWLSRSQEN
jgi:hypothetical protein